MIATTLTPISELQWSLDRQPAIVRHLSHRRHGGAPAIRAWTSLIRGRLSTSFNRTPAIQPGLDYPWPNVLWQYESFNGAPPVGKG